MVRRFSWLILVAVLVFGAAPLRASSTPALGGQVALIEFCEQAVCGAAYFFGLYAGQFGSNPHAVGTIIVRVTHTLPLPEPGVPGGVTGGAWLIKFLNGRTIGGIITGGALSNNDDGTYQVIANMLATFNGTGTNTFVGTLSHNTFPPTLLGLVIP